MNVTVFFSVHVTAYMMAEPNHLTGEYHAQEVNWFLPLHRDLRRVYGYHINFHL